MLLSKGKYCVKVIHAIELVTAVPFIDTVVETGCSAAVFLNLRETAAR